MLAAVEWGEALAKSERQPMAARGAGEITPPASPSIVDLTQGMVAGNEDAYRSFYEAYFQRLLRYLLVVARGDEDAARETLQATLVRVVRHIKVFREEEQFWNWLTVLARTAYTDRHRKRSRYAVFLDRFRSHTENVTPCPENAAVDAQLLAELELLVARLPAEERQLVERKYFAGDSVRDLAVALQASEKAVESRLGRVRRKLKELLLEKLKHEAKE